MTTKIGQLGHPRIAIALVWFLPANSSGETAPDGAPPEPDSIAPEEIEFVRGLTGMEPMELLVRLRGIADRFRDDPASMREEIVRLADGDEITAGELIRLIRAAETGNYNRAVDSEETTGEADILDFVRPDDNGNSDDNGNPDDGSEP